MALDSFVIGGLAAELHQRLENARVDKVTMPRRDRIILHLRTLKEGNVRLLLCAGNGARVHLTQEKFDKLVQNLDKAGGIAAYSYLGDLAFGAYRRLLWKVEFKGVEKSPATDMLFEVLIIRANGQYRIAGFGFRP